MLALLAAPAFADGPEDGTRTNAGAQTADDLEFDASELALDLTLAPHAAVEHPRLEIEVPLGESTRAVADFVAEFVTTGVVVNEQDQGTPDQRIHRVRGSYKRGALALTWRVSF